MTTSLPGLFLGSPRFPEDIEREAADVPGRWTALVARSGPLNAAAQVKGDFAVALPLQDGSVFMAVDRFAIRSLCYLSEGSRLSWGARADEVAGQSPSIDPQALFDYLYFHVIPSPRTAFIGVRRLPAAHHALWRNGSLTVEPYWVPRFEPARSPAFEPLREEFRTLLQRAVARQLDGSTPGCFLSGGTDSSTVAGMIGLAAGRPAITYSVGFQAEGYDEMAYARLASSHFGCEHREIYVTPEDLLREIPRVAGWYDQPFGNSSALPSFVCSMRAQADGISRLLAGDGGDELFGGNSRYADQRVFDHYQRIPQWVRRGILEPVLGVKALHGVSLFRRAANYARLANTPLPDRGQDYNLLRRVGESRILEQDFLRQIDSQSVDVQQRQVWSMAHANDVLDRHLAYDWRYTLAECDLPKVVGTTTLAGLSAGFPMLDDDLVDFSMRLPVDHKVRGDLLRWFFKEALRGFLPDGILTKKKQGFGLPFGVWMVEHQGLRHLAEDAVKSLAARGLVERGLPGHLFRELLPQHPHYFGTLAWILIMLEHWLRARSPDWRVQG